MEVLAKLGVDWKLLLAQAVNFAVLFWVLRRFAYQPMLDFLEKRTVKIEQGLKDAEAATAKLSLMEAKEKAVLTDARTEAKNIIALAEESAKKRDAEHALATEAKVKRLLEEAQMKIAEEKDKVMTGAKEEIGELVMLSVEKILREKIDATKGKEMMEKMVK
ncbi:MAG: F0F1 ATP synthase subunit B [Candidatus Moranbacteria bacterium]|nr:F0F1 ATP synthase subunit B [Candidatus Moranbacteria bacterium]